MCAGRVCLENLLGVYVSLLAADRTYRWGASTAALGSKVVELVALATCLAIGWAQLSPLETVPPPAIPALLGTPCICATLWSFSPAFVIVDGIQSGSRAALLHNLHLGRHALNCMANLVRPLEGELGLPEQAFPGLGIPDAEHQSVSQDLVWVDRVKIAIHRNLPERSSVLVVSLAWLLGATIEAVSFERDVLVRLAVFLKLGKYRCNLGLVSLVFPVRECGEDLSSLLTDHGQ